MLNYFKYYLLIITIVFIIKVSPEEDIDHYYSPDSDSEIYDDDHEDALKADASDMFSKTVGFGGSFGSGFGSGIGFGSGYSGGFGFGGMFGGDKGYVNQKDYDVENKNAKEEDFKKAYGAKGENSGFGNKGFNEGVVAVKDNKADIGFYKGETGQNKQAGDNKEYYGAKHIDEQGKTGEENNAKRGFKKGHSTKGFKTSARKDEEEKSETFYDEVHDEAEDSRIKGTVGSFGQKESSNIKGGKEEKVYKKEDKGGQGQFEKANILDANKGEKGLYQQQSHVNNEAAYGLNSGVGAQSLLGHQEAAGGEKHYGHRIVPFYGGY